MLYEIMYDYDDEWTSECNLITTYEGTWDGLQEYIEQLRENGCSNITAACTSGDEFEDEWDGEEYVDPWEASFIRSVTGGDYSSANPWDAPGMSVSDFI